MPRFGPAGNSASFYESGYKSSAQMPEWLSEMGLDAYEYQCGKGVMVGRGLAAQIGDEAVKHGIFLSLHAPYFINLANTDPVKREKSKQYVHESLQAAEWMGAKRVVVHVGSYAGRDKAAALKTAAGAIGEILAEAQEKGFGRITICPEVLGKYNQIGSLEEITDICRMDERLIPTVDFGHMYARSQGDLKTCDDFIGIFEFIGRELGGQRLHHLHCHFSKVEYTKGGEKKHRTLAERQFGPDFAQFAEAVCKMRIEPVIICESRDCMAEDALEMKRIYSGLAGRNLHIGGAALEKDSCAERTEPEPFGEQGKGCIRKRDA